MGASLPSWTPKTQIVGCPPNRGNFSRDPPERVVAISGTRKGVDSQEKYGRYLGVIWLDKTNVNDLLVSKGFALYREY